MTGTPKADRLREQREARHHAEQVRQKAEKLREKETEAVSVKSRSKSSREDENQAVQAAMQRIRQRRTIK